MASGESNIERGSCRKDMKVVEVEKEQEGEATRRKEEKGRKEKKQGGKRRKAGRIKT